MAGRARKEVEQAGYFDFRGVRLAGLLGRGEWLLPPLNKLSGAPERRVCQSRSVCSAYAAANLAMAASKREEAPI